MKVLISSPNLNSLIRSREDSNLLLEFAFSEMRIKIKGNDTFDF